MWRRNCREKWRKEEGEKEKNEKKWSIYSGTVKLFIFWDWHLKLNRGTRIVRSEVDQAIKISIAHAFLGSRSHDCFLWILHSKNVHFFRWSKITFLGGNLSDGFRYITNSSMSKRSLKHLEKFRWLCWYFFYKYIKGVFRHTCSRECRRSSIHVVVLGT